MSERSIHSTWKCKGVNKNVPKARIPIVGMVYQSSNNIGLLVSIEDDYCILQLADKSQIKVLTNSLTIQIQK
jgi:hypothetical protein